MGSFTLVSLVYIDYLAFSLCTINISSVHSFHPWNEEMVQVEGPVREFSPVIGMVQMAGMGHREISLVSVEPIIWRPNLPLVQNFRLWDRDKMDWK